MSRLYTRTGDHGMTSLLGGVRVSKADERIELIGTIDELNAWLGQVRLDATELNADDALNRMQSDLFSIGAYLASNGEQVLDLAPDHLSLLEQEIDHMSTQAPPLMNFVLPGGSKGAVACHLARVVSRRAERRLVAWHTAHAEAVPDLLLSYVNRLSDWLFAAARASNAQSGIADTIWQRD